MSDGRGRWVRGCVSRVVDYISQHPWSIYRLCGRNTYRKASETRLGMAYIHPGLDFQPNAGSEEAGGSRAEAGRRLGVG